MAQIISNAMECILRVGQQIATVQLHCIVTVQFATRMAMSRTFLQQICARRSVTQFLPTLPEDFERKLMASMEAARHAPNHKRTEPWKFHLLGKRSLVKVRDIVYDLEYKKSGSKESALLKVLRWEKVPKILALTSARSSTDDVRDLEDYAATCCAAQNFMLSLSADGLGTKWITGGVAAHPNMPAILGFETSERRTVGLFWVGVPETQAAAPFRRKSVHDILVHVP
jgi:nitroreductase